MKSSPLSSILPCLGLGLIGSALGWLAHARVPEREVQPISTLAQPESAAPAAPVPGPADSGGRARARTPGQGIPAPPTPEISEAGKRAQTSFLDMLRRLEADEDVDAREIEVCMRLLEEAGEPGQRILADFLRQNMEVALHQHLPDKVGWANSMRAKAIMQLGKKHTPESEAAMAFVATSSPDFLETFQAGLFLRRWNVDRYDEQFVPALMQMARAELADTSGANYERRDRFVRAGLAAGMFGEESMIPQIWDVLRTLEPVQGSRNPWGEMIACMPGEMQEKMLLAVPMDDPVLAQAAESDDMAKWHFGHPRTVAVAAQLFSTMDQAERVLFLRQNDYVNNMRLRVDFSGTRGASGSRSFSSAEDQTQFFRKLEGADTLLQMIEANDGHRMKSAERLLLRKRRAEIVRTHSEAADWPVKK